jgi:hypothetical protein
MTRLTRKQVAKLTADETLAIMDPPEPGNLGEHVGPVWVSLIDHNGELPGIRRAKAPPTLYSGDWSSVTIQIPSDTSPMIVHVGIAVTQTGPLMPMPTSLPVAVCAGDAVCVTPHGPCESTNNFSVTSSKWAYVSRSWDEFQETRASWIGA